MLRRENMQSKKLDSFSLRDMVISDETFQNGALVAAHTIITVFRNLPCSDDFWIFLFVHQVCSTFRYSQKYSFYSKTCSFWGG